MSKKKTCYVEVKKCGIKKRHWACSAVHNGKNIALVYRVRWEGRDLFRISFCPEIDTEYRLAICEGKGCRIQEQN